MPLIDSIKQLLLRGSATRQSQLEIALSSSGAIIGIALVAWLSPHIVGDADAPFIVASMGAAAVLLYAAPHSPLTQPWSFIGGHLISASIGVMCAQWVPDLFLASGLAVGLAIFAMHQLQCLHPPGGAAALVAVVGGDQIHALGYLYVLMPVALNVFILGAAVWLTRVLIARHRKEPFIFYQEEHLPEATDDQSDDSGISTADLNHALQDMHTYIDVSIEDLKQIYNHALIQAHQRQLGDMSCRDMMKHHIVAVEFGDYLDVTWSLMQQHSIKSIPVIDRAQRIIGIISVSDFKQAAMKLSSDASQNIEANLKALIKRSGDLHSNKAEVVGQLMTSTVFSLPEDAPISAAVTIFSAHNIGHIPISNHENRLSGMLSRSDVLFRQASN